MFLSPDTKICFAFFLLPRKHEEIEEGEAGEAVAMKQAMQTMRSSERRRGCRRAGCNDENTATMLANTHTYLL